MSEVNFKDKTKRSFQSLRNEEMFCDVTLVSNDNKLIPAHRAILSMSSPLLKNILKGSSFNPYLFVKADAKYLEYLLDFIYKGESRLQVDEVPLFLKLGKELEILSLMNKDTNDGISLMDFVRINVESNIKKIYIKGDEKRNKFDILIGKSRSVNHLWAILPTIFGISRHSLRILHDGRRLTNNESVSSLETEEEQSIYLDIFTEQPYLP